MYYYLDYLYLYYIYTYLYIQTLSKYEFFIKTFSDNQFVNYLFLLFLNFH